MKWPRALQREMMPQSSSAVPATSARSHFREMRTTMWMLSRPADASTASTGSYSTGGDSLRLVSAFSCAVVAPIVESARSVGKRAPFAPRSLQIDPDGWLAACLHTAAILAFLFLASGAVLMAFGQL